MHDERMMTPEMIELRDEFARRHHLNAGSTPSNHTVQEPEVEVLVWTDEWRSDAETPATPDLGEPIDISSLRPVDPGFIIRGAVGDQ